MQNDKKLKMLADVSGCVLSASDFEIRQEEAKKRKKLKRSVLINMNDSKEKLTDGNTSHKH